MAKLANSGTTTISALKLSSNNLFKGKFNEINEGIYTLKIIQYGSFDQMQNIQSVSVLGAVNEWVREILKEINNK